MGALRVLIATLSLILAPTLSLAQAQGKVQTENGGVIILLHPDYSMMTPTDRGHTLVLVTSSPEFQTLSFRFHTESNFGYVHVAETALNLHLTRFCDDQATGYVIETLEPVLIVTREYAAYHY